MAGDAGEAATRVRTKAKTASAPMVPRPVATSRVWSRPAANASCTGSDRAGRRASTALACPPLSAGARPEPATRVRLPRGGRIVAVSAHQLLHVYVAVTGGLGFLRALSRDQVAPLRQPVPEEKLRGDDTLELGELDLALFRELGMDGRTSHADLAKAVGWSESTVRRQMDQLRESGTLLYDLELDLPAFGFRAPTWLWLSVPPSELAATGAAFGEFPEVAYAAAVTGAFNLLACAVCRDEEEFYDFLTTRVGSLRAVDRVETSPIIRTLKQSSTVLGVGLGAGLRAVCP